MRPTRDSLSSPHSVPLPSMMMELPEELYLVTRDTPEKDIFYRGPWQYRSFAGEPLNIMFNCGMGEEVPSSPDLLRTLHHNYRVIEYRIETAYQDEYGVPYGTRPEEAIEIMKSLDLQLEGFSQDRIRVIDRGDDGTDIITVVLKRK